MSGIRLVSLVCQREPQRPTCYLRIENGRHVWTGDMAAATRFPEDMADKIRREIDVPEDYIAYALRDLDVEAEAGKVLASGGIERDPDQTAMEQLLQEVCQNISDWDEIEERAEEEDVEPEAYIEDGIRAFFHAELYHQPSMRVYRSIRVTCPPEDVRTSGTADLIGYSWSTAASIEDPTFLDQYGEEGGRDVSFVADIAHEDINWAATIAKRLDPIVSDYEEIVLRGEARPVILSVTDPGMTAGPRGP